MSISTLTTADRAQWEDLFRQYIAFYRTSLPDAQYDNTFSRLLDPEGDLHAYVIRAEDGKLQGIAHYFFHRDTWSEQPSCYLNDLFVKPDVRGKGYGRQLITATGKAAQERGCYLFYWITQNENATARKLYDSFGKSEFANYRFTLPHEKFS